MNAYRDLAVKAIEALEHLDQGDCRRESVLARLAAAQARAKLVEIDRNVQAVRYAAAVGTKEGRA